MRIEKSSMKREDSLEDNSIYNQISPTHSCNYPPMQQESSVSDSSIPNIHDTHACESSASVADNPTYGSGVNQNFADSSPRPQRSTIRQIQNPVYGDPFDRNSTYGNVYSAPQPPTYPSKFNDDDTGQPEYSYAMVQVSGSGAATQLDLEKSKTSQSTEIPILENEYAVVDMAANVASHTFLPYNVLKHEHTGTTSDQGELQTDSIRLADDESLGYSVLT